MTPFWTSDASMAELIPLWVRKTMFFLALTGGLGGLQGVFAVQIASGSPYLLSLGFSKSLMALIWLAGPLAGVIGQPYFGLCSDQCRISWGKRKPFIAAGALVTILALLGLAWAHDIAYGMAWTVGLSQDEGVLRITTLTAAAICVWVLNFAIQPLQGGLRALIIDCCPPKDMDTAFAWAGRMVSVGNVLGYGSGFVDFSRFVKCTSDAQFEALAVLATCGLAITIGLCCFWVLEQNPNDDGPPKRNLESLMGKIRYTYHSVSKLPPRVVMVFKVQFCSWLGWFSFLYYITTYIGEIYMHDAYTRDVALNNEQPIMALPQNANRRGSLALLIFASVQLTTSVLAPFLIPKGQIEDWTPSKPVPVVFHRLMKRFSWSPWVSLCSLWVFSHVVFAACMFSTFFINTVINATVLVGIVGISAALSQFVPFTLIGLIIAEHNTADKARAEVVPAQHIIHRYETQTGIVMGLHNIAIAAPQLFSAFASSFIFWILKPSRADGQTALGDAENTAWVLRLGGVSALVAIYMIAKMLWSENSEVNDLHSASEQDPLPYSDEEDETSDLLSFPIEELEGDHSLVDESSLRLNVERNPNS